MSESEPIICELCRAALAAVAAIIPPLGDVAGKRVFYCDDCDHYTFTDWQGSLRYPSAALIARKSCQASFL